MKHCITIIIGLAISLTSVAQNNSNWELLGFRLGKDNHGLLELGNYEILVQNDTTQLTDTLVFLDKTLIDTANNNSDWITIMDKKANICYPLKNSPSFFLLGVSKHTYNQGEIYMKRGFINFGGRIGNLEVSRLCLMNPDYSQYPENQQHFLDLSNKALRIDLNIITVSSNTTKRFRINSGIGLTWENYVWSNNLYLQNINHSITPVYPEETTYKKSKLMNFGLHIPIQLIVNISREAYFSAGVYGNWFFKQHSMTKKPKEHYTLKGVNDLQGGVVANIGYDWIYVSCRYSLTPLFKRGEGPKVAPLSFGLGISLQQLFNIY